MSVTNLGRLAPALLAVAVTLCLTAGCYETEQEVGPRDQAKVDVRFVGDWEFRDPESGATVLTVRNFNDREYYLEWADAGSTERHRAAAFVADAGGASFAHVRELSPDGVVRRKHFLLHAAITPDGRLTLRHLNDKFFEGKDVSTSAKLRKVVEENAATAAMYDDQTFTGVRLAK